MRSGRPTIEITRQKLGFYADFLLCPIAIGALLTHAWTYSPLREMRDISLAFFAGVVGWSLAEYLLHRYVLHALPPFRRLHALHHAAPRELIGAPAWLSPALALVLFALTCYFGDVSLACGATVGVTLGYLVYVSVHYATHHLPNLRWPWLRKLRRAHALHHRSALPCNFGVSTGLWDAFFRTAAPVCPSEGPGGPTRDGRDRAV